MPSKTMPSSCAVEVDENKPKKKKKKKKGKRKKNKNPKKKTQRECVYHKGERVDESIQKKN